jgi:hypothetical protein
MLCSTSICNANIRVGARPAGACTCDRADTENAPVTGVLCSCGARPAGRSLTQPLYLVHVLTCACVDACTCEKAVDGGAYPDEIDFTTKK